MARNSTAPDPALASRAGRSLVGRLVRAAVFWALPSLALAAFTLTWLYRQSTYQIFEQPLTSAVTSLIASAETIPQDGGKTIISLSKEPLDPRYQRALSGLYWEILSPDTDDPDSVTSKISSRSLYGGTLILPRGDIDYLLDNLGADIRAYGTGPDQEELRIVARSVLLPDMQSPVIMAAAMDAAPAEQAIRRFALLAITIMVMLTLGLIGAVLLQVRLGLRPLFDLRDRVADVRQGRATRVEGEYPLEIDPLADELNSLIAHNRDVVDRARTHVSNLAHALKTPLAVLQNEAESSDAAFADLVKRQTGIMSAQVSHHLSRARTAARAQTIGVTADISKAITDMARTMERVHRNKDLDITISTTPQLLFRGEGADLTELVGNLLDNACKWAHGRVRVSVSAASEDLSEVQIRIEDDGPGLKPDEYASALQRGVRLDETTPGTGFGLSIVDDLASAYKGSVTLGRSELGGLDVIVTLPATTPQPS